MGTHVVPSRKRGRHPGIDVVIFPPNQVEAGEGRRPRNLLAGGIYNVYNRVSRGEHVFRDEGEAGRFEALLAGGTPRMG